MTFRHIVTWRVDADDAPTRSRLSEEIAAALRPLPARVPTLQRMEIGINAIRPGENADVVVTMDFADRDGFERYRDHRDHLIAGGIIAPLYRSRLAVDFLADE